MRHSYWLLRINPFWKPLEKYKASRNLPKIYGKKAYEMIWEPLIINKFGLLQIIFHLHGFGQELKKELLPCISQGGFLEFAKSLSKRN
jgi:hypothetical protein